MAESAQIVGKKELAAALAWGRMRLDRRLASDANFPVVSRGDQSGGWKFDLDDVLRHLGVDAAQQHADAPSENPSARPTAKRPASPAIDRAQLAAVIAPPLPAAQPRKSAHHAGEATARQRMDDARARKLEREEAVAAGELLVASEVRQRLATIMISLAHDLDGLPEQLIKDLELKDDAAPGIRARMDAIRTEMVKRAEPMLAEPTQQ